MKNYIQQDIVTYNLISYSAFKALYIFNLLLNNPMDLEDIKQNLDSSKYFREGMSLDAIRIYVNTFKYIGCKISKKHIYNKKFKYVIDENPFQLSIPDEQIESLIKLYKSMSGSIEISDLMILQNFFIDIMKYIKNDDLQNELYNLLPLKRISSTLIKQLLECSRFHYEITIKYRSLNTRSIKDIVINIDKMFILDKKLYISGVNSEYNNYSRFLVERIIKIEEIRCGNSSLNFEPYTIYYKLSEYDEPIELLSNEKIIDSYKIRNKKYLIIEIKSKNKFDIMQRILSYGNKCEVFYPSEFKNEIITCLKRMRGKYND